MLRHNPLETLTMHIFHHRRIVSFFSSPELENQEARRRKAEDQARDRGVLPRRGISPHLLGRELRVKLIMDKRQLKEQKRGILPRLALYGAKWPWKDLQGKSTRLHGVHPRLAPIVISPSRFQAK